MNFVSDARHVGLMPFTMITVSTSGDARIAWLSLAEQQFITEETSTFRYWGQHPRRPALVALHRTRRQARAAATPLRALGIDQGTTAPHLPPNSFR